MQQFTFKYQNTKGWEYFVIGLIIAPFAMIFSSIFLLDHVSWIFWFTIPLMIAIIVWSIRRFLKVSRSVDTITIDDEGFNSKDYGYIAFKDIESIPPFNMLQAPPPSMRIRLHNGRKICWLFNPQNTKSKQDITTFTAFRELLLLQFMQLAAQEQRRPPRQAVAPAGPGSHSKSWQDPSKAPLPNSLPAETSNEALHNHHEEIITQLYSHKKRDYKYVTIPIAALMGILFFLRTCGTDFIQSKRDREMKAIRSGIMGLESKYEENIEQARAAVDRYTKKFGSVYLLTNDQHAALKYMPLLSPSSQVLKDVIGLRRVADNEKLEKLIAHPDSANYQMVIYHPGSRQYVALSRSALDGDSSRAVLYLSVYDGSHSLFDSTLTPSDPAFRPVQFNSSIPIPISGNLRQKDLQNMNYAAIRSLLLRYKDARFYMAARESDYISADEFEKMKDLITRDLENHDIATDQFQVKTFNAR